MPLTNIRTQYAVGQGYFQAGELFDDKGLRLRYVVDCGAMPKYAMPRDARIDAYLKSVGAERSLDILLISHAHIDHLNGVERLLDKAKGLAVKTIVLPLLNVEDRLIPYARAVLEDPMSANDSFYKAFVVDPISALRRFNPERIFFVEPGNRDGGAPFSGGPDRPVEGHRNFDSVSRDNDPLWWKIVGSGAMRPHVDASGESEADVYVMPDTLGLACASSDATQVWLLAPFVDPSVEAGAKKFIRSLAAARGQTVATLKKWLLNTRNLKMLLTDHLAELKAAYTAVKADLNVTSMCLYSGPTPTSQPRANLYAGKFGNWTVSDSGKDGAAWLGTADAALGNKNRLDAFFKHYRSLLDEVVTLTLPHHGSDHNFDAALLSRIQPSFCVASADQFSTWKHPGTAVIQLVASTGRFLSVVTSSVDSEVSERVWL